MKRTKIIRNLIISALTAAFLLFGGISVGAEELPDSDESYVEDVEVTEEGSPSGTEQNLFEEIYEAASGFSSEILSIFTFAGSLIVAFAYRKGLLPTVKNGIGAIGNAIGQMKEATDGYSKHQDEMLTAFNERLTESEKILERFGDAIDEIAEKTEHARDAEADRENVKALMSAQIDMLYEIFMTSQLPQYQKDSVSRRIKEMREDVGIENEAK